MASDKKSFVLYTEYAEHIDILDMNERGELFTAILAYVAGAEIPEISKAAKICFSFIKSAIDRDNEKYNLRAEAAKSKAEQSRANVSKAEQNGANVSKAEQNGANVSKAEQNGANGGDNVYVNDNVNVYVYSNPPYNPPLNGGKSEKEAFIEAFPKFKTTVAKCKRKDIDFTKLTEELKKCKKWVDSVYSFSLISDNYESIMRGDKRDKLTPSELEDEKIQRERWYSARRNKAEMVAEQNLRTVRGDKSTAELMDFIRSQEQQQAKADAFGYAFDDTELEKAKKKLPVNLKRFGLTIDDLKPQYYCDKCKDTGYDGNGIYCRCYERGVA